MGDTLSECATVQTRAAAASTRMARPPLARIRSGHRPSLAYGHRVPEVDTTQDKGTGSYKIVHKTEAKDMWNKPPKRGGDGSIMSRTEKAKMLVSLSLITHHLI